MKIHRLVKRRGITTLLLLVLSVNICAAVNINLTVSVPASTPDDAKICITGNHNLLANWDGKGIALKEIGPGLFAFSGNFPAGTNIEFKFTRGSFATVEKTSQGLEQPNHKIYIKAGAPLNERVTVEAWSDQLAESNSGNKPVITGDYRIIKDMSSKFLEQKRNIIVLLPPSYSNPAAKSKRFPVLYMHDGRNLFDPTTSFGGMDWGVDEAMAEGYKNGIISEAIVVGIDNTAERMSEYTPFPDPKHKGGNGENYAKFLVEELKPRIDKEFRTLSDRSNTFVGGSSLGGLISLYVGISRPKVFSGIIAMSPSIWWANGGIIDWLLKNDVASWKGSIWLDMGTNEGEEGIEFTRKLAAAVKKSAPNFKGLNYQEFSGATHSESSWKQRMHLPLQFMLPVK